MKPPNHLIPDLIAIVVALLVVTFFAVCFASLAYASEFTPWPAYACDDLVVHGKNVVINDHDKTLTERDRLIMLTLLKVLHNDHCKTPK